ncbi:MAG: hypothetical protein O2840_01820 [bacterium]|nr:hypothetical protein [bacterium]
MGGSWVGPSNYCGVAGDGCCTTGTNPGGCAATGAICGTGAAIPGAGGTHCNLEMISYVNVAGQVVLEALKTDGSPCPRVWGGRVDWVGDTFGGLAVWKQEGSNVASDDLLRPNYPNLNASFPALITKSIHGILPNDNYKVAFNDPVNVSHTYLLNPACATNATSYSYHDEYVYNRTEDRDQNAAVTSEERWKAMRQCHSKVVYKPIECIVTTVDGTVVEGENLKIELYAGERKPIRIDGADRSPGYTARLFLGKPDYTEISPLPASLANATYAYGSYALTSANCTFSRDTGKCSSEFNISDLPVGSYKFYCDIPAAGAFEPQNCTGNPWCSVNGGNPADVCVGWLSCSADDSLNVVVGPGIPPAPENLTSSCVSPGNKMTLSWDLVPGADSYLVRVDDGIPGFAAGQDNVESVLHVGADTCGAGYEHWDVCVQTTTTSLQVQVDPATFESAIWRIYPVNDAGQGPYTEETLYSCLPDCSSLAGPTSIIQGQTGQFSADFTSNYGFLGAEIDAGSGGSLVWDAASIDCGDATTSCSQSFDWDTTGVTPGDYDVFCRAWNDSIAECMGDGSYVGSPPQYACPSEAENVTKMSVEVLLPKYTISGNVYEGLNTSSTPYCSAPSPTAWGGGGSMSVTVSGFSPGPSPNATTSVNGSNGVWSSDQFDSSAGTATLQLNNLPAGYDVICPAGGQYLGVPANADATGVNFFISQINGPWWQTRSGLAGGTNMISSLPYSSGVLNPLCDGVNCIPFLSASALVDADPFTTAGIPTGTTTGTSGYDSQHLNASDLYFEAAAGHVDSSTLSKDTYSSLSRRFDLSTATSINSPLSSVPSGDVGQGSDSTEVYTRTGDLEITPSATWSVTGKKVLFVKGNVTISETVTGPSITVAPGSFFAVVATGNITFDQDIGTTISHPAGAPSLTPQIEGLYVADGTLTVAAASDSTVVDKMFVGAGTFVGWGGVSLPRDFETDNAATGLLNNYVPTDTFIFRPDFILNTPELMKRSSFNWREINSITQE